MTNTYYCVVYGDLLIGNLNKICLFAFSFSNLGYSKLLKLKFNNLNTRKLVQIK